jgi:hypothetical protein
MIVIVYGQKEEFTEKKIDFLVKKFKSRSVVRNWDNQTMMQDNDLIISYSKPPFNADMKPKGIECHVYKIEWAMVIPF